MFFHTPQSLIKIYCAIWGSKNDEELTLRPGPNRFEVYLSWQPYELDRYQIMATLKDEET